LSSAPWEEQEEDEYQHVVVRAIPFISDSRWNDDHWAEFDTRYETTRFPTDYLWGPGTREEARAWLEHEQPEGDSVDFTDRVFLVQDHGRLLPPMRPAVAAGLPDHVRIGVGHAVRADFPDDAFAHVRGSKERFVPPLVFGSRFSVAPVRGGLVGEAAGHEVDGGQLDHGGGAVGWVS
jgi:hypothetical protein